MLFGRTQKAIVVLWAAVLLFVLAVAGASAAFVRDQARAAHDDGTRRLAGFAGQAEAALNRSLVSVDLRLNAAALALGRELSPVENGAAALAALVDRDLLVDSITLVDAQARVLASSRPGISGRRLPLPAGFAAAVLAQTVPQMMLSNPGLNFTASGTVLHAARPLHLGDGRPALVVVEVPLSLLATLMGPAVDVPGLQLTLERDDGELLASLPRQDQVAGGRLAPTLSALNATAVPVRATGRLDGQAALVASRPLLYRQLAVGASWRLEDMLARHHRERNALAAMVALVAVFALGAGAMCHAYIVRMTRTRSELAASKAVLDQALASIAEGFLLCDSQDHVVTWNERYVALFPWLRPVLARGVPFRRLAEAAADGVCAGQSLSVRLAWVEDRLAAHREANRVWEQDLGNGVFVQGIERRTPDGGTVSVFRDVAAKERRLEEARRAAEQANEAKSRFLATMSHEIRTPLNAVLGLASLLLETPLSARQRGHVELMRVSGQNLLAVINDILDVTQIEAGRMKLELIDFEPLRTVESVVDLLRVRAQDKGLALRLNVAPALPAWLRGDPNRLAQLLFNLVGNAIKFTESGAVQVSITHVAEPGGGAALTLEVADTGIGIPPEALPRLFERFTQVDGSTRRRFGGSGLGLSITRDIVLMMGGRIDVHSRPGQGSTFVVTLTLGAPEEAPVPALAAQPPTRGQPRRVLVAEDNPVNQIVIQAMLEQMGHRCDMVSDGEEVLQQVHHADYDLVLMDMQMPRLDGLAATRAIRALPLPLGQLPIVAMTANALVSDRRACHAAGMTGFISKPMEMEQLAGAIERACAENAGAVSLSRFGALV